MNEKLKIAALSMGYRFLNENRFPHKLLKPFGCCVYIINIKEETISSRFRTPQNEIGCYATKKFDTLKDDGDLVQQIANLENEVHFTYHNFADMSFLTKEQRATYVYGL